MSAIPWHTDTGTYSHWYSDVIWAPSISMTVYYMHINTMLCMHYAILISWLSSQIRQKILLCFDWDYDSVPVINFYTRYVLHVQIHIECVFLQVSEGLVLRDGTRLKYPINGIVGLCFYDLFSGFGFLSSFYQILSVMMRHVDQWLHLFILPVMEDNHALETLLSLILLYYKVILRWL